MQRYSGFLGDQYVKVQFGVPEPGLVAQAILDAPIKPPPGTALPVTPYHSLFGGNLPTLTKSSSGKGE